MAQTVGLAMAMGAKAKTKVPTVGEQVADFDRYLNQQPKQRLPEHQVILDALGVRRAG